MIDKLKVLRPYISKKAIFFLLTGSILFSVIEMLFILSLHTYSIILLRLTGTQVSESSLPFELDLSIGHANALMIGIIIFSGIYRYYYIKYQIKIIHELGIAVADTIHDTSFINVIDEDNSTTANDVKTLLTVKIDNFIGQYLLPLVNMFQSFVSGLMISVALLLIDAKVFLISSVVIGVLTASLIYFRKARIAKISIMIVETRKTLNRIITDSIDNRSSLNVNGYKSYFRKEFFDANSFLRNLQSDTQVLALTPKYLIETVVMCLIFLVISVAVYQDVDLYLTLPVMIAFIFACQKLLPIVNLSYFCYTQIKATWGIAEQIFDGLKQKSSYPATSVHSIPFPSYPFNIHLKNIEWQRGDIAVNPVLNAIFTAGNVYKITGRSGVGKSSLLKVIAGLENLKSGSIYLNSDFEIKQIDQRMWEHVTYVPQNDVLFETSIIENITLSKHFDQSIQDEVQFILDIVGLREIMISNKLDLKSRITNRSNEFSGGQKQRLMIARALYNIRDIMILDEAASALDHNAEIELFNSILQHYQKNRIILFVSHNSNNLPNDSKVLELK